MKCIDYDLVMSSCISFSSLAKERILWSTISGEKNYLYLTTTYEKLNNASEYEKLKLTLYVRR